MLGHGGDDAWWSGLDGPARRLVIETAQRGLLARNLIVGTDGDPPLRVAERRDSVDQVRAIVLGTGADWRLSALDGAGEPGVPEPIDAAGFRIWLLDAITGLAGT